MSENKVVTELEIANVRHNISLLRSQAKAGRTDNAFLAKQLDRLDSLLERFGQQQAEHGQKARFEALYTVSRVLGSSLDLQTVLDQVMDAIIQLTKAERGFLMLRDDDGGITVKAARNFDQQSLSTQEGQFSRTITNQVIDTGEAILTTNAIEDPRFAGQASIVAQALRSVMATPLRARGSVIGVVYVDNRALAGLFRAEDLTALDAFSAQAAIALDNAMLFSATDEELSRRVEELRQLRRIDLLLNESLDANKAMSYTLEWACRLSNATSGYLGLIHNKTRAVENLQHYGQTNGTIPREEISIVYPGVNEVITSGKAIRSAANNAEEKETSPHLVVPIKRENSVLGFVLLNRESKEPFTEEQQDLVERVVARAAVTIENARLYAAVQAADKAKSEFVGIVAHDLKAPMTSIKGYSELMLMQGGLSERHGDFLKRIKDTVHRMEMLVSDLADISRIESGHFYMEYSRVAVNDVIQAIRDSTLPQFQERRHTFVEKIDADLPDMYVDYYRLLQVLTNLVSNAYKYTPDGGTITLHTRQTGDRVEFCIEDTGIGLSAHDIAKLGTKFWRAEDDFTRSQPGTGLGFSITRGLIEQMGDTIRIESEVGKGSKFTFSVPVAKA